MSRPCLLLSCLVLAQMVACWGVAAPRGDSGRSVGRRLQQWQGSPIPGGVASKGLPSPRQICRGNGVAVCGESQIYIGGRFSGTKDLDPTEGTRQMTACGSADAFLVAVNNQSDLVRLETWGGAGDDGVYAVACDSQGGVCVAGTFEETLEMDPRGGQGGVEARGASDVFVSRFDSRGSLVWSAVWGSNMRDYADRLATDEAGNVYVCGFVSGTAYIGPDRTGLQLGGPGAFLSKLDSGGELKWFLSWEGRALDVAVAPDESIYVSGYFSVASDFDPGPGEDIRTPGQSAQAGFVTKFTRTGEYRWARTWAHGRFSPGDSVAADDQCCAIVAGHCRGLTEPPAGRSTEETGEMRGDRAFLYKWDPSGEALWTLTWGEEGSQRAQSVCTSLSGDIYIVGTFTRTVDFDPGPGTEERTSAMWRYVEDRTTCEVVAPDCFLSKFNPAGEFVWTRTWGTASIDDALDVDVDLSGTATVTGTLDGALFLASYLADGSVVE